MQLLQQMVLRKKSYQRTSHAILPITTKSLRTMQIAWKMVLLLKTSLNLLHRKVVFLLPYFKIKMVTIKVSIY